MSTRRNSLLLLVLALSFKATVDVWYLHVSSLAAEEHMTALRQELTALESLRASHEQRIRKHKQEINKYANHTTRYAYAFVVGGCNDNDGRYRGFLYNILVATTILREEGSVADVIVFIQMSRKASSETLPSRDERPLRQMGVQIKYLPQPQHESFYDTVLQKFRILELTQYRRVMLLDADVMPMGNLDYLMELSETILMPNVVVAGALEPANGGMFVLQPGGYKELQMIIRKRQRESLRSNVTYKGYRFDPVKGWGHAIEPPDQWVARRERGTNWTFHFAFSDQGLLYHWTKYVRQSVSIIFEHHVENWGIQNDTIQMVSSLQKPFANVSKPRMRVYNACHKFICDCFHFVGEKKPWLKQPPKGLNATRSVSDLWWHTLLSIEKKLGLELNISHWKKNSPPLGLYATFQDMEMYAALADEGLSLTRTKQSY